MRSVSVPAETASSLPAADVDEDTNPPKDEAIVATREKARENVRWETSSCRVAVLTTFGCAIPVGTTSATTAPVFAFGAGDFCASELAPPPVAPDVAFRASAWAAVAVFDDSLELLFIRVC
jgi:hypothetical protein